MNNTNDAYQFIKSILSNTKAAEALLSKKPYLLEAKTPIGETALHYLVIEHNISGVEWLLKHGADVNTRSVSKTTPLMDAAQLGYEDMVLLLITNGAEINLQDNLEETALFKATQSGYPEILDALLEAGADPNITDGNHTIYDDCVLHHKKRERLLAVLAKHHYYPK